MHLLGDVAVIVIFFGSGLSFLMALEQISGKNRDTLNVLSFLLLLCNALIILQIGFSVNMVQVRYPLTTFLFLTSVYSVGPLNLFYYRSLLDSETPIPYRTRLHILPAVVVFIVEIIVHLMLLGGMQGFVEQMFMEPYRSPFTYVVLLGSLFVLLYLFFLSKIEFSLWNSPGIKTEVRLMAGLNLVAKLSVVCLVAGLLLRQRNFLIAGGLLLTCIHVIIFLAHNRYPLFFQRIKKEIKKKRYEKSLLTGLNTELVYTRLMELMKEEEVYKDMEISLATFAERMSITPHQLSQFLNEHLSLDFRNFINSYRVEEAKKILLSRPGEGILNICFDVGFNSKSTFNTVFKKQTGMSPSEFRSGVSSRVEDKKIPSAGG